MRRQESLQQQIEVDNFNIDENGCQIDYFVEQLNGDTKEMHFICNDWQFRDIMENVLGYDLARKNHFWIHYPEHHQDDPTNIPTSVEVHYKDIMARGNVIFTFADMKQIAVWHELQKLDK